MQLNFHTANPNLVYTSILYIYVFKEEDSIASRMKRRKNQQPDDDDDENNSYEY